MNIEYLYSFLYCSCVPSELCSKIFGSKSIFSLNTDLKYFDRALKAVFLSTWTFSEVTDQRADKRMKNILDVIFVVCCIA